jgi:hypothetical protein
MRRQPLSAPAGKLVWGNLEMAGSDQRRWRILRIVVPTAATCGMFMSQIAPTDAVTNLGEWWKLTGWPMPPFLLAPLTDQVVFAASLVVLAGAIWFFWVRRVEVAFPDGHETDASVVLHRLLHESRWAEREHRRVNFREFVNHLAEFRRAARDDGLRMTGVPKFGGASTPIDSRHWEGAKINPETAEKRGGVCSQSLGPRHLDRPEFCSIRVRTDDVQRAWPLASPLDRLLTTVIVGLKRVYYWLTPDAWAYRYRQWHANRRARVRFERTPFFNDVEVKRYHYGTPEVARFHYVRVTNPNDKKSAEKVRVFLARIERSVDGVFQEMPLGTAPRLLRWTKQEHAPDKGWGPRDIPQGQHNDVNVITVGDRRVHIEWEGPGYISDPQISAPASYRITLEAIPAEGTRDTLQLYVDWDGEQATVRVAD